jgi:glycosyltransferase involved in cell wall biosynthesis
MEAHPLVSCLCLTHRRLPLLRRSVSCFLAQTYQPRELVVVCQSDDPATRDYLAALGEPSVRFVELPSTPRVLTGSLRNISLEAARGHYMAVWDDDDWHGPTRLAEQIEAIRWGGRPACILCRVMLYDAVKHSAFLSRMRTWEGSLVAERTAMPPYPDLQQGSDVPVVTQLRLEGKLVALDRPELYVYVYHGGNTWNWAHWEQNVLPRAEPLPADETGRLRSLLTSATE